MLPSSFLQLATAIPTQSRLLASQPFCLSASSLSCYGSPKACQVFLARTRRLTDTASRFWSFTCRSPASWLLSSSPSLLNSLLNCNDPCRKMITQADLSTFGSAQDITRPRTKSCRALKHHHQQPSLAQDTMPSSAGRSSDVQ
jgi:hypothetical protein